MTSRYWLLVLAMGLALAGYGNMVRAEDMQDAQDAESAPADVAELEDGDEFKPEILTLDKLPAVVKATLLKEADGGKLDDDIEKSSDEEGKEMYLASANINGRYYDFDIDTEGVLYAKILDEDRLTLDKVPEAVKATMAKEADGAKVVAIYKGSDEEELFVTMVTIKGQEYEITVGEDGKLISKETAEEEDIDEDEDEEPEDGPGGLG